MGEWVNGRFFLLLPFSLSPVLPFGAIAPHQADTVLPRLSAPRSDSQEPVPRPVRLVLPLPALPSHMLLLAREDVLIFFPTLILRSENNQGFVSAAQCLRLSVPAQPALDLVALCRMRTSTETLVRLLVR